MLHGMLPEAPRRIFRLWGRHGGPILVLRATQSARGCVPWMWNDQDVDTDRWATRGPDQWSLPAPHWSARARCERYRSRLEYKLIPCGFLHWDGLQAPGGSLATINITLRRYLPIRPPPRPSRAIYRCVFLRSTLLIHRPPRPAATMVRAQCRARYGCCSAHTSRRGSRPLAHSAQLRYM